MKLSTTIVLALSSLASARPGAPSTTTQSATTGVESLAASQTSAYVSSEDDSGSRNGSSISLPLELVGASPGQSIGNGTELRILCVGDSITTGQLRDSVAANGYRKNLKANLEAGGNEVVFAGMETRGDMADGYFAAWSGETIQHMSDNIAPSLEHNPNIVLVHAGTNDMNPRLSGITQGNDAENAAVRLGRLVDQIVEAVPDAVVLVAVIIDTCVPEQMRNTKPFQELIPEVVRPRLDDGNHVLAVNMSSLGTDILHEDCVHPSVEGYEVMAEAWYDFMTQIPDSWIKSPEGPAPRRGSSLDDDDDDDDENYKQSAGGRRYVVASSGSVSFWLLLLAGQALMILCS